MRIFTGGSRNKSALGQNKGRSRRGSALLSALQERKDELEPETLASVERNIAVIDAALAEVHEALAMDPASPELGRMLVSTHRKRVDVLRKMVKLSTAL